MTQPESTPQTSTADQQAPEPDWAVYFGLFLITLSTLLLELGLTRIFSVIMYYHMAFFAVSVTLFGMALGGVIVHFLPRVFTAQRARTWMARMAAAFAVSLVAALVIMLAIRFDITRNRVLIGQLLLVSVALAVPFTCSGVSVAIALTRFPRRTNRLYGCDLAGAALGCLLFAPLVSRFGGPGLVLCDAVILSIAAWTLAGARGAGSSFKFKINGYFLVIGLTAIALIFGNDRWTVFQVRHVRGGYFQSGQLAYDEWNAISRITGVAGRGHASGTAPEFHEQSATDQITLMIDMFAATPLTRFDGERFDTLFYPFHDVSYAVHAVIEDARVAVIGVGGGRDVLAAKAWGQPQVVGIELNSRVIEALTEDFHDYGGCPRSWPGVTIVQDEARSYLARAAEPFDVIQASLIDTFAATAAGAFVLSENGLYTLQGWRIFFDHLTERGILTMSRWYTEENPVESTRLLALARAALEERGAPRPQDHILMLRTPRPHQPEAMALATILVKKSPFTRDQVEKLEHWAVENHLIVLVTPERVENDVFRELLESENLMDFARSFPFDISPPTDDKPFFFDVLRWRDLLKKEYRQGSDYIRSINLKPLVTLGTLLATVIVMAFAFVIVPLWIELRRSRSSDKTPLRRRMGRITYFMMLGLGYIMVELTLMQRFTNFLGHPAYSLMVCLFTMLLASGLGSMAAPRLFGPREGGEGSRRLQWLNAMIFVTLLLTLAGSLWIMRSFVAAPTPVRILLAGLAFAPAGFLMGMPFPLALQAAAARPGAPLSWYWGINGAFSVCASVAVVALGHSIGLNGAFVCGALCYLCAALVSPAFGALDGPSLDR